jgi:hypothetical protein
VDVTLDILLVLSNVSSRVSRYRLKDDQFVSRNLRGVEHQDGICKLTIKIHWFITTLFPLNKPHTTHQQKP